MTFVKHRENPRRGVPGMLFGKYHDIAHAFATELIPFGVFTFQDSADESRRLRLGVLSDVIADLRGVARFTQLEERPYNTSISAGIPLDHGFDEIRKGKVWMGADTGIVRGELHFQLTAVDGRTKGLLYQTATFTGGGSIDVSTVATVFEEESNDGVALIELLIR